VPGRQPIGEEATARFDRGKAFGDNLAALRTDIPTRRFARRSHRRLQESGE